MSATPSSSEPDLSLPLGRPPRVLVTGAGGPSGVCFLRALDGAAERYAADLDPNGAGLYLVPRAYRMLVPPGAAPGYAEALLRLCARHEIDVLVPTVDAELVALARAIVSTLILVFTALPGHFLPLLERQGWLAEDGSPHLLMIVVYAWLGLSLPLAWLAKLLTGTRLRFLAPVLLHLVGYGSLLAACLVAAWVQERRKTELKWDKTEKTGKVAAGR
ncbi:hypothetical protein ACFWIN_00150 [Streptomyces sp. NPDC127049]|uniref:hypothetical protein n=1 Tax=Streptomyces sp. NPDC127049 TaxID=3347118 RepID=UPI00365FFDC6